MVDGFRSMHPSGINDQRLERGLQAGIESAWPRRAEGLRVRKLIACVEVRQLRRVEEGPIRCVLVIEDVIDPAVDLISLVDLVRGVNVEDGITRQLLKLVGFVAHEILVANPQRVATDLECVGDRIIEPGLDAVARNRRDNVTRRYLDVATVASTNGLFEPSVSESRKRASMKA